MTQPQSDLKQTLAQACSTNRCEGVSFENCDLSQEEVQDVHFLDCHFAGAILRGVDLRHCHFEHCQFNNDSSEQPAQLSYADLRHCVFDRCNLTVVDADHSKLYGARFQHCQMQGINLQRSETRMPLTQADLVDLTISHCNVSFADFSHLFLPGVTIEHCRAIELILDNSDLTGAYLIHNEMHNMSADTLTLRGADLRGSSFNTINPRAIDLEDVRVTPEQLLYLAEALGILVEDLPE